MSQHNIIHLASDPYSQREERAKSLKQKDNLDKKEELRQILKEHEELEQKQMEMTDLLKQLKTNFKEAEKLVNQFDATLMSLQKK